MKVNLIQKSNQDESFVTKCSYCPQGNVEVSILYSYEAGHYEALIPKTWNLTGESSPQLNLKINQNRRLEKFLEDKDRKKLEEEKKQETKNMSRIVSFHLERTCA